MTSAAIFRAFTYSRVLSHVAGCFVGVIHRLSVAPRARYLIWIVRVGGSVFCDARRRLSVSVHAYVSRTALERALSRTLALSPFSLVG